MKSALWLILLLLPWRPPLTAAAPPDLRGIAYQARLGSQLPLETTLHDERGASVPVARILSGKPLILTLGYFHCPNLCAVVRANLFHALRESGLAAGRDYTLIALSIDPAETHEDAAAAKAQDISRFPADGAQRNWHYLSGAAPAVQRMAAAVGFRDRFDPQRRQFAHPAGVVFATPAGRISGYLLGVGYRALDIRLAVTRATRGSVASAALPVLLLCYDYNPATGRYTLRILKLLRLVAALSV